MILKTWTEDGPVRHDGEFYNYRFLNVWPRPMQKPHPKIYIVGSGSQETVDVATDFRAGYSIVFTPIEQQLKAMANFREAAEAKGWTVQPDDTIFTVICYVADTDEEAVREARPHIEKFFSWMHRVPPQFLSPPGYVSRSEFLRRAQSAALADGTRATWDDMVSIGRIICGSPDTVADTLSHWAAGGAVQPHAHGPPARRHARVEGRQEHAHVRQGGHPARAGRGRAAARRPRSWRG